MICLCINESMGASNCPVLLEDLCFGGNWTMAAAHGTHSMDLFELRYFFDTAATEENNVPSGAVDMSASTLVLPHAPKLDFNSTFHTPAMHSTDYILSNWENDDILMRGASPLEKVIHNLHMYESLSNAGQMYKSLKKNKKQRKLMKRFCPCLKPQQEAVEARINEIVQTFQVPGTGTRSWRRNDYDWKIPPSMLTARRSGANDACSSRLKRFGVDPGMFEDYSDNLVVPPLVNSTTWDTWRQMLPVPVGSFWNYQLSHYIYCRLNTI